MIIFCGVGLVLFGLVLYACLYVGGKADDLSEMINGARKS